MLLDEKICDSHNPYQKSNQKTQILSEIFPHGHKNRFLLYCDFLYYGMKKFVIGYQKFSDSISINI